MNLRPAAAYIGGYAIECGLKAFFPMQADPKKFKHDIKGLHKAITLLHVDPRYAKYAVRLTPLRSGTRHWTEQLRYEKTHSAFDPISVNDILDDASVVIALMQEAFLDGIIT